MLYDIKSLSKIRKQLKLNLKYFKLVHIKKIIENQKKIYSFLSKKEKALYHSINNEYKKVEFLGSRFLIKLLAQKIIFNENPFLNFKIPLKEIEIIKIESKPILYVKGKEITSHQISISHKNPLIFVTLNNKKVGVDIEKIQDRILNLRSKFVKNKENNLIKNTLSKYYNYYYFDFYFNHLFQIYYTCLWASKESIIKMLSIRFSKLNKNIMLKEIIKTKKYIKYGFLLKNLSSFHIKKRKNLQIWIYSKSWIYNNYIFNITKLKKIYSS